MRVTLMLMVWSFCAADFTTAQREEVKQIDEKEKVYHKVIELTQKREIVEDCYQPKETGKCFALFRRYAFNVEKRQCEEFIYGGCAGNKNNFDSLETCESHCFNESVVTDTTTFLPDQMEP